MTGIKETREVIAAGKSYATAVVKSCEDGKLNLFDARHMLTPIKATATAVSGVDQVMTELRDVDAAELDVLIDDFGALGAEAYAAAEALKKLKAE
jgi:hypothetical protein